MNVHPTKLELVGEDRVRIEWSDDAHREYSIRELRDGCPCATCREKRKADPEPADALAVIQPSEAGPLKILAMNPVGHYAYSIDFSDGHDTGIFEFELLRVLGQAAS